MYSCVLGTFTCTSCHPELIDFLSSCSCLVAVNRWLVCTLLKSLGSKCGRQLGDKHCTAKQTHIETHQHITVRWSLLYSYTVTHQQNTGHWVISRCTATWQTHQENTRKLGDQCCTAVQTHQNISHVEGNCHVFSSIAVHRSQTRRW